MTEIKYLYSIRSGIPTMVSGYVEAPENEDEKITKFYVDNSYIRRVSVTEGKVYQGMVWLSEINEKKASELLLISERKKLGEFRSKVEQYKQRINKLNEHTFIMGV